MLYTGVRPWFVSRWGFPPSGSSNLLYLDLRVKVDGNLVSYHKDHKRYIFDIDDRNFMVINERGFSISDEEGIKNFIQEILASDIPQEIKQKVLKSRDMAMEAAKNWNSVQQQVAKLLRESEKQNKAPNILALCTGNLNRSALMEMIMKDRFKKAGINATVRSAGTLEGDDNRMQSIVAGVFLRILNDFISMNKRIDPARLEKSLKDIAGISEKEELTYADIVSIFYKFDKKKYGKLYGINALSKIFDSTDKQLRVTKEFNPKLGIMTTARNNGIDKDIVDGFTPRIVTPSAINQADVIIVADRSHVDFIRKNFPQSSDKTFLLKALSSDADPNDLDLPDPQAGEITEEGAFKEIRQLIDNDLMPLFPKNLPKADMAMGADEAMNAEAAEYKNIPDIFVPLGNNIYLVPVIFIEALHYVFSSAEAFNSRVQFSKQGQGSVDYYRLIEFLQSHQEKDAEARRLYDFFLVKGDKVLTLQRKAELGEMLDGIKNGKKGFILMGRENILGDPEIAIGQVSSNSYISIMNEVTEDEDSLVRVIFHAMFGAQLPQMKGLVKSVIDRVFHKKLSDERTFFLPFILPSLLNAKELETFKRQIVILNAHRRSFGAFKVVFSSLFEQQYQQLKKKLIPFSDKPIVPFALDSIFLNGWDKQKPLFVRVMQRYERLRDTLVNYLKSQNVQADKIDILNAALIEHRNKSLQILKSMNLLPNGFDYEKEVVQDMAMGADAAMTSKALEIATNIFEKMTELLYEQGVSYTVERGSDPTKSIIIRSILTPDKKEMVDMYLEEGKISVRIYLKNINKPTKGIIRMLLQAIPPASSSLLVDEKYDVDSLMYDIYISDDSWQKEEKPMFAISLDELNRQNVKIIKRDIFPVNFNLYVKSREPFINIEYMEARLEAVKLEQGAVIQWGEAGKENCLKIGNQFYTLAGGFERGFRFIQRDEPRNKFILILQLTRMSDQVQLRVSPEALSTTVIQKDKAMNTLAPEQLGKGFLKGGIDLNSANLNLQIKRDGKGVPLPISQQDLESIHIDGLVPVILSIKPAMNSPLLSELQISGAQEQAKV